MRFDHAAHLLAAGHAAASVAAESGYVDQSHLHREARTFAGLLGLLLAFLWCCTAHRAGWANHNLLLLSPLCLLLLPGGWRIARGRPAGPWFRRALLVVAVLAGLAPVLQLLPGAQYQLPWIALLLPVHLAFAFAWARR